MLAVRDLEAGYGAVEVLRGASLDVARGELVTLVGPNGAGKSTLLRVLTGLLPARGGRVELDGVPLHALAPEAIVMHGVALVPEGRELFGPLSVRVNLSLGAYATPRVGRHQRIADDIERVLALFPALRPRLAQPVATLSGGEQQMVAIGRALMARPRLLLLDEPSVGLAPLVIRAIFDVLARLRERRDQLAGTLSGGEQQMVAIGRCLMGNPELIMFDEPSLGLAPMVVQEVLHTIHVLNQRGLTILLVEQNVAVSLKISSRAYVLENGRVVMSGSGAELLHDDRVRQAYLGL